MHLGLTGLADLDIMDYPEDELAKRGGLILDSFIC